MMIKEYHIPYVKQVDDDHYISVDENGIATPCTKEEYDRVSKRFLFDTVKELEESFYEVIQD